MKKIFFYGLIVFLILIMISGVFGYKRLCLKKGEFVPPDDPRYVCNYAQCIICVTDNYYPTHPGRCNDIVGCESLGDPIDPIDLAIVVESPVDTVYSDDKVLFDIDLSKPADLYYILDDEEKKLCSSCSSYKREKSLDDGNYEITFKAVYGGEIVQEDVGFVVDSEEPKIRNTEPKKGFANGEFLVEYDEENLKNVKLYYGNADLGTSNLNIAVREDCESGKKKTCKIEVNLSGYEKIYYFFELEDNFNNVSSELIYLDVDFGKPELTINTPFNDKYNERKVLFDLSVNEEVDLYYLDHFDGKASRLCSKCDSYTDEVNFKDGYHDLEIIARDKAGNEDKEYVAFSVDTEEPKIRNTEPKRGFANGEFLIEYDEENLEGISLFYNGNEEILQCESGKKKQCVANVNLEGYDEVTYYFVVSDSFNAVTSKSYTLDVDMEEPVFEEFDYLVDGRYVYLNIKVSEEVKLEYNDGGRWRTLKTRTDNYNGKKSFKKGYHEVIVRGIDGAGNIVSETFNFVIQ